MIERITHVEGIIDPAAPYSLATISPNGTVELAGQIGMDESGQLVGETIEEQTHQAIKNVRAVLGAIALELTDITGVTAFIASETDETFNTRDYPAFNTAYGMHFAQKSAPARTAVRVAGLPRYAKVELKVNAYNGKGLEDERDESRDSALGSTAL